MLDFDFIAKNWGVYKYPWRPWEKMLRLINKVYKKNDRVLILWSTKEFRLLFKNVDCTIFDKSIGMVKAWSIWNNKEKVIIDDWLNLDNSEYDLIIWDLIFFLIEEKKQKELITILQKNLSKKWNIIIRYADKKKGIGKNNTFNKSILDLSKTFNSNLQFFNYITFEYVIWLWYNYYDIYNLLINYNKDLAKDFEKKFLNLVPYNNIKMNNIGLNLKKYEYTLNDFFLVKEKVVLINKDFKVY